MLDGLQHGLKDQNELDDQEVLIFMAWLARREKERQTRDNGEGQ